MSRPRTSTRTRNAVRSDTDELVEPGCGMGVTG